MAVFRIPLVSIPQRFKMELGGLALEVVSRWNGESACWVLDFIDADTGLPLLLNLPVVTGADLFSQFRHTRLGAAGSLIAFTDGDLAAPPGVDNLGAEGNVFFLTAE